MERNLEAKYEYNENEILYFLHHSITNIMPLAHSFRLRYITSYDIYLNTDFTNLKIAPLTSYTRLEKLNIMHNSQEKAEEITEPGLAEIVEVMGPET